MPEFDVRNHLRRPGYNPAMTTTPTFGADLTLQRSPVPRKRVILPLLLLAYPVGLALMWRRTAWRTGAKTALSILFAPAFVLLMLLCLMPWWDFTGDLGWTSFSLDFTKGPGQYNQLEAHRAQQKDTIKPGERAATLVVPDWTNFRGPNRDGIVASTISLDWSKKPPRQLYRQPVGEGYSSFVLGGGRAYTMEQRRGDEALVCYDAATGRELWTMQYPARFTETLGGDGPRATPTLDGERVYTLGAEGHLFCVKAADGEVIWNRHVLKDFGGENLTWAMSGSPLIVDDMALVTSSGVRAPAIQAYDKLTGKLRWDAEVGRQGYTSLVTATLLGTRQVLNLAADKLIAIDPANGKTLWTFPWPTSMGINCSQPIPIGEDRVFVSAGYGHGCALVKLARDGEKFTAKEVWSSVKMKNKFSASVIFDGHVYGLDEGTLACLNLDTGERKWKGKSYGHGNLLLVAGARTDAKALAAHVIVLSEDGELALVRATPEKFEELGAVQALKGRTWNNFSLTGTLLLARNHKEMVAYDLAP